MAKLQKKSIAWPEEIRRILHQYWGFPHFRPLQEEIILSVLSGKDTLALMPTGGGKSLTFQVPALFMEGICLVVTPLIALMKDQVDQLTRREIKAVAIHSGMTRREIDITLDNCTFGDYKFLYVSPERLKTDVFRARVRQMPVNLLAVDEAHCISEWGYDFRPSYLEIKELREVLADVPVLALTATATPEVAADIQDQLAFPERNLLRKSFDRENLAYVVRKTEDKHKELLHITSSLEGSGIVYTRSRKKCGELAGLLQAASCTATSYHAGLKQADRDLRQQEWIEGKKRIMVATNAFGMGIDKANVRFVIHMDLPDTPEAYFQEAGRAGRDGIKSWAILLYGPADKRFAEQRIEVAFPGIQRIRKVYQALGNYFQVPLGSGKGRQFDFEQEDFLHHFRLEARLVQSAISFLVREGYLALTDSIHNPSRLMFRAGRDELYSFQVNNAGLDAFIRLLLRSYSGVFSSYARIDEALLARRSGLSRKKVYDYLVYLAQRQIIYYIPRKRVPVITFLEERLDEANLHISPEKYNFRKERYVKRLREMIRYAEVEHHCRNQFLLGYFGQLRSPRCGRCDVCVGKKEVETGSKKFNKIRKELEALLAAGDMELDELVTSCPGDDEEVLSVLACLLEEGVVRRTVDLRIALPDGGRS